MSWLAEISEKDVKQIKLCLQAGEYLSLKELSARTGITRGRLRRLLIFAIENKFLNYKIVDDKGALRYRYSLWQN